MGVELEDKKGEGEGRRQGGEMREKRKLGEATPGRTRKGKARQDKTRKARQGNARKARQGGARQGKGEQVRPRQEILMMLEFSDKKKM